MKKYEVTGRMRSLPSVRKIGRPKKFQTVEELEDAIQGYFDSCFRKVRERVVVRKADAGDPDSKDEYDWADCVDLNGNPIYEQIRPLTVTGLAISLDTTRDLLLDYENKPENADFSDTVKRAKAFIHEYAEEYLYDGKNQTGGIFNLKNNWGWVDRTETDLTTKGKEISSSVVNAKADDILSTDDDDI